jgi:ferrous iron transport protein A
MNNSNKRETEMMPLGLLTTGEKAEVIEVRRSRNKVHYSACCSTGCISGEGDWTCRMENMGLRQGRVVQMLNNGSKGAMLIKVDESRIAIGRGMAMKIMVRRQGR